MGDTPGQRKIKLIFPIFFLKNLITKRGISGSYVDYTTEWNVKTEFQIERAIDIVKLKSFQAGEVRRFARQVTEWVYNFLLSYVQNAQDVEELVQDTLLGALDNIHHFRGDASLKTWVYRIAIHKVQDHLKSKQRIKRKATIISIDGTENLKIADPGHFVHPGILLENKEDVERLFAAINELAENQKMALVLAKIDHKSYGEIAELMQLSTKAVESLVARAKQNLKNSLEKGRTNRVKKSNE